MKAAHISRSESYEPLKPREGEPSLADKPNKAQKPLIVPNGPY